MSLPAGLAQALRRATGREARAAQPVAGGDINEAWAVTLDDGRRVFVKTRPGAPAGEYATEAAGLGWLAEAEAIAVPAVVGVHDPPEADPDGPRLLALEWIDAGRLDARGEEQLGRGLARLHRAGAPAFGGAAPLRLGAVVLPNDPRPDWPSFYAEQRLLPLALMAAESGALSSAGRRSVEWVAERLPDLAGPAEPPARVHGDLWSGNVLADRTGRPHLIDPAAHGGHREIDLAMLALFGGPGRRFRDAYAEVAPPAAGHEDRVELWQLLPLLVHAVLFGGAYGASAERAARRYAG